MSGGRAFSSKPDRRATSSPIRRISEPRTTSRDGSAKGDLMAITESRGNAPATRVAFAHQIQDLRDDVVAMASMVDKAIARSLDALKRQDVRLAREVMA